ncbi:MAG: 50S ribosomal protein L19e [Thermoproteales archaeon]|nr:50S ribosomal protein L19e [Thermoproteales archaeon]
MSLKFVKRLAAQVMGIGESRVWIDPEKIERVSMAISREDVKRLIHDGVIRKKPVSTPSRSRARQRHLAKKKGRRRGYGSRKGPRYKEKEIWIAKIRLQRKYLRRLRERKLIDRKTYRLLYRLAKGGTFRSLAHMKMYIEEHNLLRKRP